MKITLIILLIWNICVFCLYAFDKYRAVTHGWRISEKALLITAFLFGGVGALLAMRICRHKTRHIRFQVLVPIACLITVAAAGLIVVPTYIIGYSSGMPW